MSTSTGIPPRAKSARSARTPVREVRVRVPLFTVDVDAVYRTRGIVTPAPVDSGRTLM